MSGELIKSFLVGLGFGVDEGSLAKFNKALASATIKVTALYAATTAMAAGIVKSISSISGEFEQLGYEYRIIAPAINKALILRNEMLKAYSIAGVNIVKVIQSSVKLNLSLDKTKFALKALYQSVGAKFFPLLQKQSDLFRNTIYKNMPKIQATLEKFVNFIFKTFQVLTELGVRLWSILTRVFDFFVMLDKATDGWSTIILGVIAAWKLLNLSFLATPLGLIISGLVAILALFDDFKTWQEGGKSLFDWSSFIPVINSVKEVLTAVWTVLQAIGVTIGQLASAFAQLFTGHFTNFLDGIKNTAIDLWGALSKVYGVLSSLLGLSVNLGHWASGVIGDKFPNLFGNVQQNPVGKPIANPVGNNVQNAQTNQHVNQQTSINVIGTADASQTGKAVASQQGRVNRDLVDNMKGATR